MKILIVDDDELIRELLRDLITKEGYEVLEGKDGQEALELFYENTDLSLIVLDVMMPGFNGWEVLERIRSHSQIPILILTALGDTDSEVEGLRMGAQDFVSKPFHPEVLLARIEVLLRSKNPLGPKEMRIGNLRIDRGACRVYTDGKEALLTNKEYQLLLYLVENRNIALSREQILERLWGFDYEGDIRTIDTHIKMLRTDLGTCGNYVRTVRGVGYMFQTGSEEFV